MYGLVNRGIRTMVCETFDEATWERIRERSGVNEEVFISMEPYPDEVTLQLVGAASEVLELPPEKVLHAFGTWWIGYAAREYDQLFTMTGQSFPEFVANLNSIHTRVGYMMTQLSPPSFTVTDATADSFILHYHSTREGLFPMVHGMIEGIAQWFETPVEVTYLRGRADGIDHDEYAVRFGPAVAAD